MALSQDGRHSFQFLHKQVGKAFPPLFWVSCAIHFWSYIVIDSCGSFSHTWLFNFFLAYSYPWSFLPAPGCQAPPLKLWSLKAFSFTSHPCTTGHSVPCLNWISLCLWCILWGSDWELSIGLQSGKQMALIYLAISRHLEGHILVTVRPSLIVYGVLKS